MVTWDTIECTERNGIITGYAVEVWKQDGIRISEDVVMGQSLNASGLTPATNYTFRVAGINTNGTGPFTEIIISTEEDSMYGTSVLVLML